MESWSEALIPLWLSVKIASCATALIVLPGALAGLVLARKRFRGKALVETVVEPIKRPVVRIRQQRGQGEVLVLGASALADLAGPR